MNEDDVVALCVDCGSIIPDSIAERDPFIQQGLLGVCRYCGGPVTVTDRSEVENIMRKRRSGGVV